MMMMIIIIIIIITIEIIIINVSINGYKVTNGNNSLQGLLNAVTTNRKRQN